MNNVIVPYEPSPYWLRVYKYLRFPLYRVLTNILIRQAFYNYVHSLEHGQRYSLFKPFYVRVRKRMLLAQRRRHGF